MRGRLTPRQQFYTAGIGLTRHSGDKPLGLSSSTKSLYYVSLHSALLKGYEIKVTELSPSTGKQGSQNTLNSDSEVTSEDSILFTGANSASPLLLWTDKAFKTLKTNVIGTKHVSSIGIAHNADHPIENIIAHAPRTVEAQTHLLVHYQAAKSHWAEVYHVDPASDAVKKAYDLPQSGGLGAFSTSTQGNTVYFIRNSDTEITLVSSTSNEVLGQWAVHLNGDGSLPNPQGISHAVSEVVSRGASNFAVRSALALRSGDWELVRNGDSVWVRPEALAGVVAAAWAELSEEENIAQELAAEGHSSVLTAFVHRLKRHARDLQHFPAWAQALLNRRIGSNLSDDVQHQDQTLHRDNFGFRKIVIVATDQGRLAALDAGKQGNVIWNIKAINIQAGQTWDVVGIDVEDRTAFVRGIKGEYLLVETLTGKILQYQPGGLISSLRTSVSVIDATGEKLLLPINSDGSLGDFPKGKFMTGTVIVTNGQDGIVRGWMLTDNRKPSMEWKFVPTPGEKIASVSARPAHDPVASIGKALGDRNVLYKYLNPNLLLLTTVGVETSKATFHVLDSTSGEILYTIAHAGVDTSQPIASIMSENWFAYSIFSDSAASAKGEAVTSDAKGHRLIVSELYESPISNDRGPLGSSQNYSSIYPTSSDDGATIGTPHVISQVYIIPGAISHMSVTSTLQGITPRSLLCVIPSLDALVAIPRGVIDPRRPINRDPTPAELEEGLFKHSPVLDFEPKWILNHKRDLLNISDVVTSPSLLESTSLVFAFGDVDIFGTRLSPIGAFDMLGKGFSKFQLVATVAALAVGTGILAPLVSFSTRFYCMSGFANGPRRCAKSRLTHCGKPDATTPILYRCLLDTTVPTISKLFYQLGILALVFLRSSELLTIWEILSSRYGELMQPALGYQSLYSSSIARSYLTLVFN